MAWKVVFSPPVLGCCSRWLSGGFPAVPKQSHFCGRNHGRLTRRAALVAVTSLLVSQMISAEPPASAKAERLTPTHRAELIRELNAEFGTAKVQIPQSKKPLVLRPTGQYDREQWSEAMTKFGAAARRGDLIQITAVRIDPKRLVLVLNYGLSGGRRWWHRIQVAGTSNRGTTLGAMQDTRAPGGTKLALVFQSGIPAKTPAEFRDMLKPVLDFEQPTATELYLDSIDKRFKDAIESESVIEGMDEEMVLLSKGIPWKRVRNFKDGIETKEWLYGEPPGEMLFVTFLDGEVIRIEETYAGIGGRVQTTGEN